MIFFVGGLGPSGVWDSITCIGESSPNHHLKSQLHRSVSSLDSSQLASVSGAGLKATVARKS